jgi:hypothetical protein
MAIGRTDIFDFLLDIVPVGEAERPFNEFE